MTWTRQSSGTTSYLSGVSFSDVQSGVIVGGDGTILRTSNGGATWTGQASGTTSSLISVSFTDRSMGTAVGAGGTILRTTTGGTTWIRGDETLPGKPPNLFVLRQNYPNPFNPTTTIKFELPRASHVSLVVYDILGRQVSVLVNERKDTGVYEVKFDGSSLASGVYFYRIQAGDYVATKKLLLMK
jgi:hypothetical protein